MFSVGCLVSAEAENKSYESSIISEVIVHGKSVLEESAELKYLSTRAIVITLGSYCLPDVCRKYLRFSMPVAVPTLARVACSCSSNVAGSAMPVLL